METPQLLTNRELEAIDLTAELANMMHQIIGFGPQAENDWREAAGYIHALQHMIMSQAAARAYPTKFRKLGGNVG